MVTFTGGSGNDYRLGTTDADTLAGGGGNDSLVGDAGNDALLGQSGNDTLFGNTGDDLLSGGGGLDQLNGNEGTDTVSYQIDAEDKDGFGGGLGFDISLKHNVTRKLNDLSFIEDRLSSIENVIGSDAADKISGDTNDNILIGGGGNDTIYGDSPLFPEDASNDVLGGGGGIDSIFGGNGTDTVSYQLDAEDKDGFGGGVGFRIDLSLGTTVNVDSLVVEDYLSSIENAIGSDARDGIIGTDGANRLAGQKGNDQLFGSSGNDTLSGGEGVDSIYGGADTDTVNYQLSVDDRDGSASGFDGLSGGVVNYGFRIDLAAARATYLVPGRPEVTGQLEDVLDSIEKRDRVEWPRHHRRDPKFRQCPAGGGRE